MRINIAAAARLQQPLHKVHMKSRDRGTLLWHGALRMYVWHDVL